MNKTNKVVLICIVALLLLLLSALVAILLCLNDNVTSNPTETSEIPDFAYNETGISYNGTIKYKLCITDIENPEKTISTYFIYTDGMVITNTQGSEGKIISNAVTLSNEDMQKIISIINCIKANNSIKDKCLSGYLYEIEDVANNCTYQSCGNCVDSITDSYIKIKNIIGK
jgi:hypothetical protein